MLIICFAILSLTTLTHSSVLVGREHPDYEEQFRYDVWICVDYPISKTISNYNDYSGTDAEFRSPINTFSDLSLYPRYPIAERHNSQDDGDLLHVSHLMNSLRYQVIKRIQRSKRCCFFSCGLCESRVSSISRNKRSPVTDIEYPDFRNLRFSRVLRGKGRVGLGGYFIFLKIYNIHSFNKEITRNDIIITIRCSDPSEPHFQPGEENKEIICSNQNVLVVSLNGIEESLL